MNFEEMASGRSTPGHGGDAGFGHVGEARACYDTMAKATRRLREIKDNVEADSINVEKHVKELANTMHDSTKATGRMFE